MIRLDLIEQKVKELGLFEQKLKASDIDVIGKSMLFQKTATKGGKVVADQEFPARSLLGTKAVFPSDDVSTDGTYLLYVSSKFSNGNNVYKLYNNKSSKEIPNTVKIKETSLDNYTYKITESSSGSAAEALASEEDPAIEVENLDRTVERNDKVLIQSRQEGEEAEDYQDRFIKQYLDLVKDINSALKDLNPEVLRKQWVAEAKQKEIKKQEKELDYLYDAAISGLVETANCLENNPRTKSILNFFSVRKALANNPCANMIDSLVQLYEEKAPRLAQKLRELEISDKCQISEEKAARIVEDLQFVFDHIAPQGTFQATEGEKNKLKENVAMAAILDALGDHISEETLIKFYTEKSSFLKYIKVKPSRSKDPAKAMVAACLRFIVTGIPPRTTKEKALLANKARQLVSFLSTLVDLREEIRLKKELGLEEPAAPAKNQLALAALRIVAPMIGLRANPTQILEDGPQNYPFYLRGIKDVSPQVQKKGRGENVAPKELDPVVLAAYKYLAVLDKLAINNISAEDLSNAKTNLENDASLFTSENEQALFAKLKEVFGKTKITQDHIKEINDLLDEVKRDINQREQISGNRENDFDRERKNLNAESINPEQLPSILQGITETLDNFTLRDVFENIWILGSNDNRSKIILNKIADNMLQNFDECKGEKGSSETCLNLKASIVLFLSTRRSNPYGSGAVNTPKGEAFENFTTLEVLQNMIANGLDVKSMQFNGKKGIEALTDYLRCSSKGRRHVFNSADVIQANMNNARGAVGDIIQKVQNIYSAARGKNSTISSLTSEMSDEEIYQSALVALEADIKNLSVEDRKAVRDIFYTQQGINDVKESFSTPTTSGAKEKRLTTEGEYKLLRDVYIKHDLVEPTNKDRVLISTVRSEDVPGVVVGSITYEQFIQSLEYAESSDAAKKSKKRKTGASPLSYALGAFAGITKLTRPSATTINRETNKDEKDKLKETDRKFVEFQEYLERYKLDPNTEPPQGGDAEQFKQIAQRYAKDTKSTEDTQEETSAPQLVYKPKRGAGQAGSIPLDDTIPDRTLEKILIGAHNKSIVGQQVYKEFARRLDQGRYPDVARALGSEKAKQSMQVELDDLKKKEKEKKASAEELKKLNHLSRTLASVEMVESYRKKAEESDAKTKSLISLSINTEGFIFAVTKSATDVVDEDEEYEDEDPEDSPESSAFRCPTAVEQKTIKNPEGDQEIAVNVYNPKAFLMANYSTAEESGVCIVGLSKVRGIPGDSAGFGDIAFMRAKNATLGDSGNLQSTGDPLSFSLDVYEGKLVTGSANINFNAFGRLAGACAAALDAFQPLLTSDQLSFLSSDEMTEISELRMKSYENREMTDRERTRLEELSQKEEALLTQARDALKAAGHLDMNVLKVHGKDGGLYYSQAQASKDNLGFLVNQIEFVDQDALIDQNIPQQLESHIYDTFQLAAGSSKVTGRKNALAYLYAGVPNKSAFEHKLINSFPGYLALVQAGQDNAIKRHLRSHYPAKPGVNENEHIYQVLQDLYESESVEKFLENFPVEIHDRIKPTVAKFIASRNEYQRNSNSVKRKQEESSALSQVIQAFESPIFPHVAYKAKTNVEQTSLLSKEEESSLGTILTSLRYTSMSPQEKAKVADFFRSTGYTDSSFPKEIRTRITNIIGTGRIAVSLSDIIKLHNNDLGIKGAFEEAALQAADKKRKAIVSPFATLIRGSDAPDGGDKLLRNAGQNFLTAYLSINDQLRLFYRSQAPSV